MKHSTHKPYRMKPAVQTGWRPAVSTQMEMTKTIQPAAPILPGNWCHLLTPLRAKWFSDTTDTNLWRKMMSVALSSEIGFLHTTDTNLAQETASAPPARDKPFSYTTDTNLVQEIMIAPPVRGKPFSYTADTNLSQGAVIVLPVSAKSFVHTTGVDLSLRVIGVLPSAGRRVDATVPTLPLWSGCGSVSWCRYGLKAQNRLMGRVSPTNFPRKSRSPGGGMCYAQVNPRRGPAVVLSSSSSFHPANLEGVPSRCTL